MTTQEAYKVAPAEVEALTQDQINLLSEEQRADLIERLQSDFVECEDFCVMCLEGVALEVTHYDDHYYLVQVHKFSENDNTMNDYFCLADHRDLIVSTESQLFAERSLALIVTRNFVDSHFYT